jgi:hypothetical protein
VKKIQEVFHKRRGLGLSTDDLPSHFWTTYKKGEDVAFRFFAESPSNVNVLSKPVNDLVEYYGFAKAQRLSGECVKCLSSFKAITLRQIDAVFSEEAKANSEWTSRDSSEAAPWGALNPCDWLRITQSFLLLSHSKVFCEEFGRAMISLEVVKHKWMVHSGTEPSAFGGRCSNCERSSLDFNGVCKSCNFFVFSSGCAMLKECTSTSHPRRRCSCCSNYLNSKHYCDNCERYQMSITQVMGYVASTYKHDSIEIPCPGEGCSKKLSANGSCSACKAMYFWKGRAASRSSVCIFCYKQLKVGSGRCSSHSCVGYKFTWKELPFDSFLDCLRCESDGNDGSLKPKYPEIYRSVVHLDVPAKLSDPTHFGHVAWAYCRFVEGLDSGAE